MAMLLLIENFVFITNVRQIICLLGSNASIEIITQFQLKHYYLLIEERKCYN